MRGIAEVDGKAADTNEAIADDAISATGREVAGELAAATDTEMMLGAAGLPGATEEARTPAEAAAPEEVRILEGAGADVPEETAKTDEIGDDDATGTARMDDDFFTEDDLDDDVFDDNLLDDIFAEDEIPLQVPKTDWHPLEQ
jgi:hypothetical protein